MKSILFVFSIILFGFTVLFGQGGDAIKIEPQLKQRQDIVFFGGFEEHYNDSLWFGSWGIKDNNRASENELIDNAFDGGKSLRVSYPKDGLGPKETGSQFPIIFNDMTAIENGFYKELYLRYYVKFEEGFDFRLGGKLPGLMGGGDSRERSGGNQPDGTNGWTLRMMWRENGEIVVYAYLPKSENGKYGSETWGQDLKCGFTAIPGQWHCIEQYVNVGAPNTDSGELQIWIDGIERINLVDMRYWNVKNTNGLIGGIYFSTFHGGNTEQWAPKEDSYAQFDGFVAAKNRVGCLK